MKNFDQKTLESFSNEWVDFDQSDLSEMELEKMFLNYFSIFPFTDLKPDAVGFDMGCGSGRWAAFLLKKGYKINCIDPSDAIEVARNKLKEFDNVEFFQNSADDMPLPENSQDFGYSLGVLHHVPNTLLALKASVSMLKENGLFLIYLYHSMDNRPRWYKAVWRSSELIRAIISRMPLKSRRLLSDVLALVIYYPLAKTSYLLEKVGFCVENIPLSFYRELSFYTMRTDARDRFGTPLEKRFSKTEIESLLEQAGLKDIEFSQNPPYWVALAKKK